MTTAIAWYGRSFAFSFCHNRMPIVLLHSAVCALSRCNFFPFNILSSVSRLLIAFFRSFVFFFSSALFCCTIWFSLPSLFTQCALLLLSFMLSFLFRFCLKLKPIQTHTHTQNVRTPIWWISLAFNSYVEIDSWNSRCLPRIKLLEYAWMSDELQLMNVFLSRSFSVLLMFVFRFFYFIFTLFFVLVYVFVFEWAVCATGGI